MRTRTSLWTLGALAAQGCVGGQVFDADDGAAVEGATVVAGGRCYQGNGCQGLNQQTTNSNGWFVFDAYGHVHGEANTQTIVPYEGNDSIHLLVSKEGYESRFVYHKPDYETRESDGETYMATVVDDVYLCPEGARDDDGDSLCNAAEDRYGTDPQKADTDGDALSDAMELFGHNDVDLAYYGANPLRRDVFVEVDYYPGLRPAQAAIDANVEAFASAPVHNPDGSTGVSLHVIVDQEIDSADADPDLDPVWQEVDAIKAQYFDPRREAVFHYALFANQYHGGGSSGRSRGIPGHDVIVTMGNWPVPGGTVQQQAGTFMHELGHNLGLGHGGQDGVNYKPHYLSIMSYNYQLRGLRIDGAEGQLDYSRLTVGPVDESALDEMAAFTPVGSTTETDLAAYEVRIGWNWLAGNASANLDFDDDGMIDSGLIATSLNRDDDIADRWTSTQNDWESLTYHGGYTLGDSSLMQPQGETPGLTVAPWAMDDCMSLDDL